jgi:hypothetical protein
VGDHIRLAHPTVLELYAQSDFMSPASAATRHEHWSHAFATQNSRDSIEILQRIRHELRAHQLQSDIEDRLTTASEELNLSLCRFVFECRADYHHFALRSPNHDTPPSFLHDVDREQYQYVGTIADQTTPATPAAALHNIAKMMELLYQGLDEWEPANRLADRLEKTLRQPWMTYGSSMKAICEFDLAKHPRSSETAITLSEPARRAFPARYSGSMTRATMLINEGIFRNNTFRRSDSFETAGALYTEAGALIDTALRREAHARFRRLLVREKLRVLSGLLRWEYLRAGFSARPDLVKSYWSAGCAAVEGECGRPVEKGMQEFAYLALNASFIELARTGIRGDVATYYREARNHQEAAGDRWFRRRLDQMKIAIDMLLPTSHQSLRQQLKELGRINDELARDDDWTGVAFCTYQIVRAERYTSPNDEGIEKEVERRYEVLRDAPGSSPTHFSKRPCFSTRLEREHFFEILLYGKEQGKYFPAWPSRQMPLNLQGLLMLRSISLLDQANWRRGGWWS